jgi:hypothetical protein
LWETAGGRQIWTVGRLDPGSVLHL